MRIENLGILQNRYIHRLVHYSQKISADLGIVSAKSSLIFKANS